MATITEFFDDLGELSERVTRKISFFYYILAITLFAMPILMCIIFYFIKKENQKNKNLVFIVWLSLLHLILINAFYHITVSKFGYVNSLGSVIYKIQRKVDRHEQILGGSDREGGNEEEQP